MNKLWDFDDYVNHLMHRNGIVRRWALEALDNRFPYKYADQVSCLLNDEDEHLVCHALRYLSRHQAVHHAPAILEKFQSTQGIISSNSAITLAKMHYEPATNVILEKFTNPGTEETFLGILDFLGMMRSEKCRATLQSAANQIRGPLFSGALIYNLVRHYNPEDVKLIMDIYLDPDNRDGALLRYILSPLGCDSYFIYLTECGENEILSKPADTLNNLLTSNPQIQIGSSMLDGLIQSLKNGEHKDFVSSIISDAGNIISQRYSRSNSDDELKDLFEKDTLCMTFLEDLSKRSALWKEAAEFSYVGSEVIAFVLSIYFGIMERGAYVNAFLQNWEKKDLIHAIENAGPSLPAKIREKIKELAPIPEIKEVLKKGYETWGGIWAVRMMADIGDPAFVPDLIYVLSNSDSLDYIHDHAIGAINALDESADKPLLTAVKNHELEIWESLFVLQYLPYSEAYDLAVDRWEAESDYDNLDLCEAFAGCLKGIGDKRGIETLQDIYAYMVNDCPEVEDSLECLSELHQVELPELPEINNSRRKRYERQKAKKRRLNKLAGNYSRQRKQQGLTGKPGHAVAFKRNSPKVGRNEPCPCGSGKKYKKCCLNKNEI